MILRIPRTVIIHIINACVPSLWSMKNTNIVYRIDGQTTQSILGFYLLLTLLLILFILQYQSQSFNQP